MSRRKRNRRIEFTNDELTKRHITWLRSGPMALGEQKFARPGDEGLRVDSEGHIIMNYQGATQVHSYGFDADGRNITLIAANLSDELIPRVYRLIDERWQGVASRYHHEAKRIFNSFRVAHRGINADKDFFEGVGVEVGISRVPAGTHGGLSDNLYVQTYNLFTLPLLKIAWGAEWRDISAWYDFSPRKSSWRENITGGGSFDDSRSA